jgi:protease I
MRFAPRRRDLTRTLSKLFKPGARGYAVRMAISNRLADMKVAILVENMFEQVEVTEPRRALDRAGAHTVLIAPGADRVQAAQRDDHGDTFTVDLRAEDAIPDAYDVLLLPGGVANPDRLRLNRGAMEFVHAFAQEGKPIFAISHNPWSLVEVDAEVRDAGGTWVDADDVVNLNEAMIARLEAARARRKVSPGAPV